MPLSRASTRGSYSRIEGITYMVGVWYRRKLHDTREASNNGKGERVRIIHGLNINQKNSYTCCKNLEVIKNQVLCACS